MYYHFSGGELGLSTAEGGARPPQLEGKRTGWRKGSRNRCGVWADAWADLLWGYEHRHQERASPPSRAAHLWWNFAWRYPDELEEWLEACGQI